MNGWKALSVLSIAALATVSLTCVWHSGHIALPTSFFTPVKKERVDDDVRWLALNIYFHRGEVNSDIGRKAVTAVVLNRLRDRAHYWGPKTVKGVVTFGYQPGRKECAFSWYCDGKDDVPDDAARFVRDTVLATTWLAEYRAGTFTDPTNGATWFLYRGARYPEKWPHLTNTGTYGQYAFYRYPHATSAPRAIIDNSFLTGTRDAVMRAYRVAGQEGLTRVKTPEGVARMVAQGALVAVRSNDDIELVGVSYPYARPATKLFVERLGKQYRASCGERLVVTSLTRPIEKQPLNASALSVHPAGIALDVRIPGTRCQVWLERSFYALESAGVLEATKERRPPHYHVVVFPREYTRYVQRRRR